MIDRVLGYVRQVLSGEIDGNEKVGKALLDALNETIATGGAGGEGAFNEHLQVSLDLLDCLGFLMASVINYYLG